MPLSKEEEYLNYSLLVHPEQHDCRFTDASDCDLRQILFRSLAAHHDEYLSYFFPNGVPRDPEEPWSLRSAQGAVDGAEYLPSAKGTACSHIFKSGESTYSCKTCAADDTCVLCSRCFESSDHEGHQVFISVSPGNSGVCDCGDREAWRRELVCSIHTETGERSGKEKEKAHADSAGSQLPLDLLVGIRMTIARCVDYLCDVLSCSPEQQRLPKTEDSVRRDERLSRLDPSTYGLEPREGEDPEFVLVLWNDEKHTVDDVQNQVARACRTTKSFGLEKANQVNDVGRSVVRYSKDVNELLKMATIIEQLKVTVTIRSARDTFREQMCATIIHWLSDISGCAVGDEPYILRNVVCEEILKSWRMGSEGTNKDIGLAGIDDHEIEDNRRERARQRHFMRPLNIVQIGLEGADNEENDEDDDNDEIEDDEYDEDEDMDEEGMEIDLEDITNAANAAMNADAADMDVDFMEEEDNAAEVMEAAYAGYPPPPPPPAPTAGQRRRILTPAESDEGEAREARPAVDAPFESVPRTPKVKNVAKRPSRPSKHWLEKPEAYKAPRPSEPCEDLWQRVRLDWLILYDLRLWKTLRIRLRHLFITTVAAIPQFKRILGLRFAGLYTPLAELYLVADREPDHSIINLSVQMLTTPSITEEVVERGNFLANLMSILYTFLTTRQVGFPEEVNQRAVLAFDAGSVTNRRIFHFFMDLRWLFQSESVHYKLRTERRYLLQFLDLVKLHQGICPNVRAIGAHVEYESDNWISASMIIKEVNRLCKLFSVAFEPKASAEDVNTNLQRAVRDVAQAAMINSFGYECRRFTQAELHDDLAWHHIGPFGSSMTRYSVPSFVVQSEPMSFHHPMHYLLSWLLENAKDITRSEMRALLHFSSEDLRDPWSSSRNTGSPISLTPDELLCGIFDLPLRVCSWLSQMKASMWVRNGITLRHQAHNYRNVAQRDMGYQRDLFMIQAGLVLCGSEDEKPGERFLAQMVDRFEMVDWMRGNYSVVPGFDETQQLDVIEDFYQLLIVAVSERSNLIAGLDSQELHDKMLQHDIAHALCFKPLSFSDLTSRVTDKVGESDDFNRVLESMTNYRPPEGLSDTGAFELKAEYIELVNPYFAHYSRNHREEAENLHKKHTARKTGKKPEDVVFEPRLQPLQQGLFKDLAAFTQTELFVQVMHATLYYASDVEKFAPNIPATRVETLLHVVLHLVLIALLEDRSGSSGDGFVTLSATEQFTPRTGASTTLVATLLGLSEMADYASCQPAIKHILRKMQTMQPDKLNTAMGPLAASLDRTSTDSPSSMSAEDKGKKKAEALARQARVMAQMKQQQNSFLATQGMSGLDDEEFEDIEDHVAATWEPGSTVEQKKMWSFPAGTCILCQEETDDKRLYGTFAFLGESNILRTTPTDDPEFVQEVLDTPGSLDRSADDIRPFGVAGKNKYYAQKTLADGKTATIERQGLSKGFPHHQHSTTGPVATSCGHIMHFACFELYLAATNRRHLQQIARDHPERIESKEFICPLCKALGNTFLPIIWKEKERAHENELHAAKGFSDWLESDAAFTTPDLTFLKNPTEALKVQREGHEIYHARSSQYVGSIFAPSLVSSMHITSTASTPTQLRPTFGQRVTSISSMFSSRPSSTDTPSSSMPRPSLMTELSKGYERIDEVVKVNKLCGQYEDGTINPLGPLSRALGFSISAIEIQHRGATNNGTSLLDELSEQVITHLRILSETTESYLAVKVLRRTSANTVVRETVKKRAFLATQLFGATQNVSHVYMMKDQGLNSLFEDDTFLFFADWLAFIGPDVAAAHGVLQLCFWAEVVKVIFVYKALLKNLETSFSVSEQTGDSASFNLAVEALPVENRAECPTQLSGTQLKVLKVLVEKYALTFLRKCLIIMHIRYGIDFERPSDINTESPPELQHLTQLLRLPTLDDMCGIYNTQSPAGEQLRQISSRWIYHVHDTFVDLEAVKLSHPAIFELVGLPMNYDALTEMAIRRRCPTTGKEINDPAVCLFCGDIFCSQAFCCVKDRTKGGCNQHLEHCGGKVGIFINIRKCMVVFLHGDHGSWAHAPYLDRHGEPDPTLRRHHQLYLNQKRYDKLMREVWLSHMIPSFISRKMEADVNPGGFETL